MTDETRVPDNAPDTSAPVVIGDRLIIPLGAQQDDNPSEDDELGFDPESPDVSDPAVDPLHPARTGNEPHNKPRPVTNPAD